jgi:hypothetical protein
MDEARNGGMEVISGFRANAQASPGQSGFNGGNLTGLNLDMGNAKMDESESEFEKYQIL